MDTQTTTAGKKNGSSGTASQVNENLFPNWNSGTFIKGLSDKEPLIRAMYAAAEEQNIPKFLSFFTDDGEFNDVSAGKLYKGKKELGITLEIYAKAFPDMSRKLYRVWGNGDEWTIELSLNGTHKGPLALPKGTIPATGKEMHAPCCDVLRFKGDKIYSFNCYTAATIILGQLGVM